MTDQEAEHVSIVDQRILIHFAEPAGGSEAVEHPDSYHLSEAEEFHASEEEGCFDMIGKDWKLGRLMMRFLRLNRRIEDQVYRSLAVMEAQWVGTMWTREKGKGRWMRVTWRRSSSRQLAGSGR